MFQSFFNGLSGMFSFSRGLKTVSNNISNMNTPGYRGNDTFFRSLNGGLGTSIQGTGIRMQNGEVRETGTATDLALNGSGFFVLRDAQGNQFYTRAGQFQFDENGILIDSVTKFQVMAINSAGVLEAVSIANSKTLPAQATTTVNMVGNLLSSGANHSINTVQVFDHTGASHTLTINFTNSFTTTAGSWNVSVQEGTTTLATGSIRFGVDGSPLAGFNSLNVALSVAGGTDTIALNFGTPGTFSGTTMFSGSQATLGAQVTNGHGVLGLTTLSFDEKGVLKLVYSNGEKRDGQRIALASFNDESALIQSTGSMYQAAGGNAAQLGRADEGVFGKVQGSHIELSNVDLTQEFADMLIIQRGYQASSRVMSVANEMVEQLYNNSRGG